MTEHISTLQFQGFRVRALPVGELASIAKHLDSCPSCRQHFVEMLRSRRGSAPLKITMAPEFQLRNEHADYEQLVRLADKTMDASERGMLDVHLITCASCREDVRSFLAFREQIDKETEPSAAIIEPKLTRESAWLVWWRGLAWKPAYAAALLLIGMALVIGTALLLKRRTANLEAKQTQPRQVNVALPEQSPSPENQVVNVLPTPAPIPSVQAPKPAQSPALTVKNQPTRKPENVGAVTVLSDGRRTVTLDRSGTTSGLEDIPTETQRDVSEALVAESIEQPEITKELAPTNVTLRGPSSDQPFKLLTPERTVIVNDRPTFEWAKLPTATAYRVIIGDMRGHEVAKSQDLSPDRTNWTPPGPLKRGQTYAWNVIAIVDGKEIVSPGASASEMKFHVLSESSAQDLEQLKKAGSHLALGVFYAREGMVADADREFHTLARQNPNSPMPKKLIKQIQSWR